MTGKIGTTAYRVEPLTPGHDREAFCCGNSALDSYFHQQAGQDQKRKLAAVFILTADGRSVDGFYTLSAQSILAPELPPEVAKKLPRFPVPVTLIGRIAVAQSLQGQGWGESLLLHALERALLTSRQVASWAVVVDAKAGAREFYIKKSFVPFQANPDRLFLPMKTIEKMLT